MRLQQLLARSVIAVIGIALMSTVAVCASEKTDVMATVHQFVDGFNKGDTKTALAACAPQAAIIDDVPPHAWQGAGACAAWASAYDADSKKHSITDGIVTLGQPRHVDVTGDRAYVVVPATYTYKERGTSVTESGSILTVALQKVAAGWRITGWAWAKH
jgi:ketosteroid isomerase-like protein